MREVYLDNSATTIVCPEAVKKAVEVMTESYGNPSSLHSKGIEAERELKNARLVIAEKLSADPSEIYFTSGGTEANNLALFGAAYARRRRGNKIVTTAVEHSSVLESIRQLEREGFTVVFLKPDIWGKVSAEQIFQAVDENTILVSIMAVNNELGTVEPYTAAAKAIKRAKAPALLHVDAVQAFCKMPLRPGYDNIDLLSISAHKVHGSKGVGALYVRKGTRILPRMFGGGHEKKLRPGTEPLPLIAAFGEAVKQADKSDFFIELNTYAREKLAQVENISINSPDDALPCILNFSVCGIRSETMLHYLASHGVYVSSGSACAMGRASHVLEAVGLSRERADSAIRVSFSRYNTKEDVDLLLEAIQLGLDTIMKA